MNAVSLHHVEQRLLADSSSLGKELVLRISPDGGSSDVRKEVKKIVFAVSGPTEHCSIFHFPPFVRPSVRHRRDISTFLDILTVYTMKTIYFLNAYHLGW